MSKQVLIPDKLYRQLSEQANRTAVSVESLITHLLESTLSNPSESITQAYMEKRPVPFSGDWAQVEAELTATESPFESLEAAMNYSRRRA